MKSNAELWIDQPEDHDYPAAADYLSLIFDEEEAQELTKELKRAPLLRRKAKDILRASGLAILPRDNFFVVRNLKKVAKGKALSPVLLVRGDIRRGIPLIVADGYHRICASWHLDENAEIPCRLVPCP